MSKKADMVERLLVPQRCRLCGLFSGRNTKMAEDERRVTVILDHEKNAMYCYTCLTTKGIANKLTWVSKDKSDWRCNVTDVGYPNAQWDGRFEYILVD